MSLHFDGDPAVDSPRRHMERVLKAQDGTVRRWKWPLMLMAASSGALWLWRRRDPQPEGAKQASPASPRKSPSLSDSR